MSGMLVLFVTTSIIVSATAGRPLFDKTVEEVTFEPYGRSQLFCNASGEEPMEYTWYDEHSLEVGTQDRLIYSRLTEGGSYLVLEQPNRNGTFTCSANNVHGRASKIFEVFVLDTSGKPDIKNVSILNITDTSVTFAASVSPSTQSIFVTYKEARDKTDISRTITTSDVGSTDLVFALDDLVPGGRYSFQFQTEDGPREKWEIKDVVLLPSEPELIILNVQGGSVKIQWFKKLDDIMRATILDYTISYGSVSQLRGNEWIPNTCLTTIVVPSCAGMSYTISDLFKTRFYEVQVKARTETGYGKPSKFKVYIQ